MMEHLLKLFSDYFIYFFLAVNITVSQPVWKQSALIHYSFWKFILWKQLPGNRKQDYFGCDASLERLRLHTLRRTNMIDECMEEGG